jgi:hypothetical protein
MEGGICPFAFQTTSSHINALSKILLKKTLEENWCSVLDKQTHVHVAEDDDTKIINVVLNSFNVI